MENRNHYNLLSIRGKNKDKNIIENKINDIVSKAGKPIQVNINKNEINFEDEVNNTNAKYINIGDKKNYYDDLYYFLSSVEKAKYTNEYNETKINWKLVNYPNDLIEDI